MNWNWRKFINSLFVKDEVEVKPVRVNKLIIRPDAIYEWYVFEDRIEVDLARGLKSRRKPDGVYVCPDTFTMYRLTYGTIGDMYLQSTKEQEEE